jgi:nitrous oxide reductase accessory protein NosL
MAEFRSFRTIHFWSFFKMVYKGKEIRSMKQNRLWMYRWLGILVGAALLLPFMVVPLLAADTVQGTFHSVLLAQHTHKDAGPVAGLKPIDNRGHMHLSDTDRCPVCAMKVKNHPKFASAIQLKDGTTFYFCGTGCMIRSWMHPVLFLGVSKDRLANPVVRDYFTGKEMDGRDAIWVAGSDIIGPMGPALVPVRNQGDLETFVRRHGGKTFFRLSEMDPQKWKAITGKTSTPKN